MELTPLPCGRQHPKFSPEKQQRFEDEEDSKENMSVVDDKMTKNSLDGWLDKKQLGWLGQEKKPLGELSANSLPRAGEARFCTETGPQSSASDARLHGDGGPALTETAASSSGQSLPQVDSQPPAKEASTASYFVDANTGKNGGQRKYSESPPGTAFASWPSAEDDWENDAEFPSTLHPPQEQLPQDVRQSAIGNEGSLGVPALPGPTSGQRRSTQATQSSPGPRRLQLNSLLFSNAAPQQALPQFQYVHAVMLWPTTVYSSVQTVVAVPIRHTSQ